MISFLMRRIAARVVRHITGEDREPVGAVSDSELRLADLFLVYAAGVFSTLIAGMLIFTFYLEPSCL